MKKPVSLAVDILLGAAILAGLWRLVSQFVGSLPVHLFSSRGESLYGIFTIVAVLAAWISGMLVAASEYAARTQHRIHLPHLRLHLHH